MGVAAAVALEEKDILKREDILERAWGALA